MDSSSPEQKELIAAREFSFDKDGAISPGRVAIYKPFDNGNSWSCRYEIECDFESKSVLVHGIDSVQSLILVFRALQQDIDKIADEHRATAYHLGKDLSAIHRFSDYLLDTCTLVNRLYKKYADGTLNMSSPEATENIQKLKEVLETIERLNKDRV